MSNNPQSSKLKINYGAIILALMVALVFWLSMVAGTHKPQSEVDNSPSLLCECPPGCETCSGYVIIGSEQ